MYGVAYFPVASLSVLSNSVIKTLDFFSVWWKCQILTASHNLAHLIFNNFEILTVIIPIELERKIGHRFLKLAKDQSGSKLGMLAPYPDLSVTSAYCLY